MPRGRGFKVERLQKDILRNVSGVIQRDVRDRRIERACPIINRVQVSPDGGFARLYVSFMNSGMSNDDREIAMNILQGMTGYFRSCLARNLAVKNVPILDFFYDDWEEQLKAMDQAVQEEQAELESIQHKVQESEDESVEESDE
tara:strand:- start:422 stop:853 length:432 start_codon:yes stop_codon:yes gene_type:complete